MSTAVVWLASSSSSGKATQMVVHQRYTLAPVVVIVTSSAHYVTERGVRANGPPAETTSSD